MRKWTLALAGLFFMACMSGCGQGNDAGDNIRPTVTVIEAQKEKLLINKLCDVMLEMDHEQYICAQVSAYVRQLYHHEGEQVSAGEKLLLLENQNEILSRQRSVQELEIARSQVEKIEKRVEEAEKNVERQQMLASQGAISQVELDKSELEWQLLCRDLEQAQGQLKLALIKEQENNLNSSNFELSAPDNLWLAEQLVSVGEYVNAGQAVFRAGKMETLLIHIELPRDEVQAWQEGDILQVECHGDSREAIIKNINILGRQGSERTAIELRLDNPRLDWFPGSMAQVKYRLETEEQVLIPAQAIAGGDNCYVYIVKDERVYRQKVNLILAEGDRMAVSGLEPGSLVVTGGLHRLRDGEAVVIKEGR
jgi:RND family efflux transporter MFP subunit